MRDKGLGRVIVGNIVLHPSVIRNFLRRATYWLSYKPETETISFNANDGGGGNVLLEIRNASYENAEKLARELGLKESGACSWVKSNPEITIRDDGSESAEKLKAEVRHLGIPLKIHKGQTLELHCNNSRYTVSAGWTLEKMFGVVHEVADQWKDQLATTP